MFRKIQNWFTLYVQITITFKVELSLENFLAVELVAKQALNGQKLAILLMF
jgi:hypothetical protein